MGFRGGVDVSGKEKYAAAAGKENTDRPRCSVVVIPTVGIAMVNKCV
jgi:hypothetical protein